MHHCFRRRCSDRRSGPKLVPSSQFQVNTVARWPEHHGELRSSQSAIPKSRWWAMPVVYLAKDGNAEMRLKPVKGSWSDLFWRSAAKDGVVRLQTLSSRSSTVAIANSVRSRRLNGLARRWEPNLPRMPSFFFDGSSADQFENGKLVDGLLAATNCTSKATFGDHTLHLEFRTPFMPAARGQGRGNSGCYIQGRYECQIFGFIWLGWQRQRMRRIYSIHEPNRQHVLSAVELADLRHRIPAAKYNDKGEKTASARVTIKHNGVVIHDRLNCLMERRAIMPKAPVQTISSYKITATPSCSETYGLCETTSSFRTPYSWQLAFMAVSGGARRIRHHRIEADYSRRRMDSPSGMRQPNH